MSYAFFLFITIRPMWKFPLPLHYLVGRDSSVGIATALRAGRSGDGIPMGARFSAPVQTGPGAHPASHTMGTGSFTWGKPAGAWR